MAESTQRPLAALPVGDGGWRGADSQGNVSLALAERKALPPNGAADSLPPLLLFVAHRRTPSAKAISSERDSES